MMLYLPNFGLFFAFLIFGQMLMAGQISVINPSAGSEITGVVSVSPNSAGSQGGSGLSPSTNMGLVEGTARMASKYRLYREFFNDVTFESFTEDQLLAIQSKLHEILNTNNFDKNLKDLIEKQLALTAQRLR